MYCTNCGAENDKKICKNCGVKQGKIHKFCKWCGNELTENATICTQCNKKVKENKLVAFLVSVIEILASVIFVVVFTASFSYFSKGVIGGGILLLIFGLLGFLIAFPVTRKVLDKKLKSKKAKALRIVAIFVFIFIIYGGIYPFANHQVLTMEKQAKYDEAIALIESDPLAAKDKFLELENFEDSSEKAEEANAYIYSKLGEKLKSDFVEEEDLSIAYDYVDALPEDYEDTNGNFKEFNYKKAKWMMENDFYPMAKNLFENLSGYKDSDEILKKPIFALVGNTYTYSSSYSYGFETYIQTQLYGFSDSTNYTFYARYRLSNSTMSNMMQGDFGSSGDIALEVLCYEENGKIMLKDKELKPLTTEDGKITSFLYDGNIFEIASTD